MSKRYLGIDAGTQGLSALLTDESLKVLAVGEGSYEMVPGLEAGCYEQSPADWEQALGAAMADLRSKIPDAEADLGVSAIGISGQMHGEVLADADGKSLCPSRLWCDSRNEDEGNELTHRFGVKMPKRLTAARWLWTLRNRPEVAAKVAHITTPAGWIAYRLTGKWTLGIGDAAGMFPVSQDTRLYRADLLDSFDELTARHSVAKLAALLPEIRSAGEDAGALTAEAAEWLGMAERTPVAPAEGDQPAALAGSLIGEAGMVSVSFGTSVCANSVGDRPFAGVSPVVDHFCAPDGKPINMVFLRNGTTFMNSVVAMFGGEGEDAFAKVMKQVLEAPADCGGIIALPFMDDEPGLGVSRGGTAALIGLNSENAKPGNAAKAALLATIFNLRLGSEVLEEQRFPRNEIILSGGLTKTPELAQLLADVFRTPVTLLSSAEEGTAWGAALMAKYRDQSIASQAESWDTYLASHAVGTPHKFIPDADASDQLEKVYEKYLRMMKTHSAIEQAI